MKKFLFIALLTLFALPARADNPMAQLGARMITSDSTQSSPAANETAKSEDNQSGPLKKVESKFVCMMNNKFMGSEQTPIQVDGRTYYGCCPMCAQTLKADATARIGTDPVSGKSVDKAEAIIGADSSGKVYYFENEENMKIFSHVPESDNGNRSSDTSEDD